MSEAIRLAFPLGQTPTGTSGSLVERLTRRFGLGAQPLKRQALYARLQALVDARPEIEALVKEAAAQAASARAPDRYFCAAVTRKLRECNAYADL